MTKMEIAKLCLFLLLLSLSTAQEDTVTTNYKSCDPATQTDCAYDDISDYVVTESPLENHATQAGRAHDEIGDDVVTESPLENTDFRDDDSTEVRERLAEQLEDFTNILEDVHNVVSQPADTGCPPFTHACVPYYQCINGEINTDGSNIIDIRLRPVGECTDPGNPLVPGICCKFPVTIIVPTPLKNCPSGLVCVETAQCNEDGTVITDGSGIIDRRVHKAPQTCYLEPPSSKIGMCCTLLIEPPLKECPDYEVCVPEELCTHGFNVGQACFLDEPNYITGVCCSTPVRDHCPLESVCTPEHECRGELLDSTNNFVDVGANGIWSRCSLQGSQESGVCCRYQPCPSDSKCVPEHECEGEILNNARKFVALEANGIWSRCSLKGSHESGVCCRHKEPDYPVAKACGIRNYNPKGRSTHTLAKNVASFGEFPWQAIIFFRNFTYKCGASLIGENWLITGAHCVNGYSSDEFKVRLGEWQVNSEKEPLPSIDVDIASIHIHPGFNGRNLFNNIALIKLATRVEFKYNINTICLPSYGRVVLPGTRCMATGWGKDAFRGSFQPILHKVDVPFVEHSFCQVLLRKTRLGRFFNLHRSFSCYGGEENKDVCTGDGGGPLACKDPVTGQYYLLGITSWGIGCGDKDVPGVYANVPFFDNWTRDKLKL